MRYAGRVMTLVGKSGWVWLALAGIVAALVIIAFSSSGGEGGVKNGLRTESSGQRARPAFSPETAEALGQTSPRRVLGGQPPRSAVAPLRVDDGQGQ